MSDEPHVTAASTTLRSGAGKRRLTRRRLLQTGLDVGLAAGLVSGSRVASVWSDSAGTITYALARPSPGSPALERRQREVPPEWHRNLRLAFTARDRLRETALEPLIDAAIVPGTYDEPTASLSVRATTETILDQIEESIPPVPVALEVLDEGVLDAESEFEFSDAHQLEHLDPDAIPGGVLCEGAAVYGTLAPAVFDTDTGRPHFVTANHVFGAGGVTERDHVGSSLAVLHEDEPHAVGTVVRGYPAADVVLVAPADGFRPAPTLARADTPGVVGQYTRLGLADLAARGEPLTKVGAVSDRTTGQIHGVDGITCYTGRVCKSGQLLWGGGETLTDGDSGSVAFHRDPDNPEYALVAGINTARTRWLGDFTWGTAAHHLLSECGLHF